LRFFARRQRGRDTRTVAAAIDHIKAHQRRAEARRHVREQNHEQHQQRDFETVMPPRQSKSAMNHVAMLVSPKMLEKNRNRRRSRRRASIFR